MRLLRRSRASKTESREETIKALRDIFQSYLESKRVLAADIDRLVTKGWPDRRTEVQALNQVTELVMKCEILRFEYLLDHVPLESPIWTSLVAITRKLHSNWDGDDESALRNGSAAYQDAIRKLEAAERSRNPAALDGPFKDARRDPEYNIACKAFAAKNRELDRQFGALQLPWPKRSGL
jgi:hypothetical protein